MPMAVNHWVAPTSSAVGEAGDTVMETRGDAATTVRFAAGLVAPPMVAVMPVVPVDRPVAKPLAVPIAVNALIEKMLATVGLELAQVT